MLKNVDPKTRGVIIILLIVIGFIILYIIYRQIDKYIKDEKEGRNSKETVDDATREYQKLRNKGERLNHPESAYQSSANAIEKLLNGCETFGSEMDSIKEVIKVVNKPIDWYFLIMAFGVRDIDNCGSFGFSQEKYDLPTLLKDQLDSSGAYNITNINGYNDYSFFTQDSVTVLENFLRTRGVTF